MTVKDYIDELSRRFESAEIFFGHGTANARDEACYLVFASLGLSWDDYAAEMQKEIAAENLDVLETKARVRIEQRVPTAYLTGVAWFAGFPFRSDERALVPRSPIAELLENRLDPLLEAEPRKILDLCCGGGCIGIAAALIFPDASVDLADISADALELAGENVALHELDDRARLVSSNLFQGLSATCYDLVLCNPPYVGDAEYKSLPTEFNHEPEMGLVSQQNGLEIPLRILHQAADYLSDQGILVMEVGDSCQALSERCPGVPFLWLEFEHGGEGVFMLTRSQLLEYRERFI
ncbi:MAG: 50S ribosomal protein L3 N(5)-glutamine methyltransferase [Gammaproteobacteria bacterium]|nr:50S ribosomal protein L3 N(5)-glutamine methyltransferase [Gammaproteobacteria bacterium]